MHRATLDLLCCPSCRRPFRATAHRESEDRIELGYLQCDGCGVVIPIIAGIALFTEPLLHAGQASEEALREQQAGWFGSSADHAAYRQERYRRSTLEPYAAFQPFNESTRALEPLLPRIAASLSPGDVILDTWCRTGWSGEWLAGRFPENRVISVWEGNSSVLGYRGFAHWLSPERRAANLDLILTHPERPLPLADASIGFLYALDSLHRYRLYPFAGECLRVSRPDAPLVFAHLHLNNSQPEPYFERGCHQFHGRDYRAWLDWVTRDGRRQGWILSEEALFSQPPPATLTDAPDMPHYNGLACLLPAADIGSGVAEPDPSGWRHVVSPLFRFHLGRRTARIAPELHDGMVGHLLTRHPVYAARLPATPVALDDTELAVLLLAILGDDRQTMEARFDASAQAIEMALDRLCRLELLHAAPVSQTAHELQRFHSNQLPPGDGALTSFLAGLASARKPVLILDDGEALSGTDIHRLHAALAASLPELGLRPGDQITIDLDGHLLPLLLALLACAVGINVRLGTASDAAMLIQDGGTRARAIGLDGAEDTLLGILARHATDASPPAARDAALAVPCDTGLLSLPLSAWVTAVAALEKQIDDQYSLLPGQVPLHDILALLLAIMRQTPVRGLPRQ